MEIDQEIKELLKLKTQLEENISFINQAIKIKTDNLILENKILKSKLENSIEIQYN